VGLWRRYWEVHFKDESIRCVQIWGQSIREQSLALSCQDAHEYVKKLTGKSELPDQIPKRYAAHDMLVAPSYFGPPHLMFYGYGSVIVIYDFLITQEHRDQNVSLANFPVWAQKAAHLLPLTRCIQAARQVIAGASFLEVSLLLAGEMLIGMCYVTIGYLLFSWFEIQAKRRGTLEAF